MEFENTLGRFISRLKYLAYQELNRELKQSNLCITGDQFRLLTHLWKEDGLTQQKVADLTDRNRGSITRMVDVLEKNGVIKRIEDKRDRRVNLIYLTESGRELESQAVECVERIHDKITQGFTEEEIDNFGNLLKKSIKNLEK
ncbi:MarR family winged helix-turn-helix transcriptional regulator [Chondrinema litorale]|uniref:MarR family winged helix-turn-helix transcriptional regulator n=1 Tax=Chondrinema litorale TaxID=2994555 RepID=UPI002543593F|nr:MarR family transcriptional regulator [Chondrinema litorale]UZR98806.1 MarR family transcriptional regulator [Chondrinema litorale]